MYNGLGGFDHVVVAVRDLDRARETWERLGFLLTPRAVNAEGGAAAHMIALGRTWICLTAAEGDGAAARRVRAHLEARGGGLMGLALAAADVRLAQDALNGRGLTTDEPKSLSLALADETVRLRCLTLDPADSPGVPLQVCQHLTPDLMQRPRWTTHPNGAGGMVSLTAVVDEPERYMLAYERIFGPGTVTPTDDVIAVHTGGGLIFLSRPDDIDQLHTDIDMDDPPEAPSMVVLTLSVADTDAAAALLKQRGVYFTRDMDGSIRISAEEAGGVHVELQRPPKRLA